MGRAQLSLSLVEAGVGVLLLLAVATSFALVSPSSGATGPDRLDVYAHDVGVVLTTASDDGPRVGAALRSDRAFAANRSALADRVAALLPATVLYRVETPRGSVGYEAPRRRAAGVERVPTPHGVVTVKVWYA